MPRLIHIARIYPREGGGTLYLRQKEPNLFLWYQEDAQGNERETSVAAPTIEEALRLGARQWREDYFQTLGCGYRFTLPERDEHGMNALFCQMSAALQTMNGVYFDEDLGHHCSVKQIPSAAYELWIKLKNANRLQ
jgi:hypothetical protein